MHAGKIVPSSKTPLSPSEIPGSAVMSRAPARRSAGNFSGFEALHLSLVAVLIGEDQAEAPLINGRPRLASRDSVRDHTLSRYSSLLWRRGGDGEREGEEAAAAAGPGLSEGSGLLSAPLLFVDTTGCDLWEFEI